MGSINNDRMLAGATGSNGAMAEGGRGKPLGPCGTFRTIGGTDWLAQLAPPSALLNNPSSPPVYTVAESVGWAASTNRLRTISPLFVGFQVATESDVLKTPRTKVAAYTTEESAGFTTKAEVGGAVVSTIFQVRPPSVLLIID